VVGFKGERHKPSYSSVIVIPVSNVDRAKRFCGDSGWRLDLGYTTADDFRMIQFTAPGSAKGRHLIVSDIEAARDQLLRRGIRISELFHDVGSVFHRADAEGRLSVAPITQSSSGLPIGLQIIGPNLEDRTTIAFAAFLEREFGGFVQPPCWD
jgi:hypothetical protein